MTPAMFCAVGFSVVSIFCPQTPISQVLFALGLYLAAHFAYPELHEKNQCMWQYINWKRGKKNRCRNKEKFTCILVLKMV